MSGQIDMIDNFGSAAATGPRVGDIGTVIELSILDGEGKAAIGGAEAVIEIRRPGGVDVYEAEVDEAAATVSYTGTPSDSLWPVPGVYVIWAVVSWADGRRFKTAEVAVTVE